MMTGTARNPAAARDLAVHETSHHWFGDNVRIVKAASPCSPCFDTDRPACPEHACLEEINPDRIVEALEGILDKERKARK